MTTMILPEMLTVREVRDLHADWLATEVSEELELDASTVIDIDGAGVQLLLAFIREHAANGIGVRWDGTSDKFDKVVETLGMNMALGID